MADMENRPPAPALDPSGKYDTGLSSLLAALKWAFGFLLVLIALMLIYFLTWGGYFSVEPQQAVIILRFGQVTECLTGGGHWYFPYPVNRRVTIQTNQQFMTINDESAPTLTAIRRRRLRRGTTAICSPATPTLSIPVGISPTGSLIRSNSTPNWPPLGNRWSTALPFPTRKLSMPTG